VADEDLGDGRAVERREEDALAAAQDGDEEAVGRRADQDEVGPRRWLLERLQKSVGGLLGEAIGPVENEGPRRRLVGRISEAPGELAHLADGDDVAGALGPKDLDVGVEVGGRLVAGVADAARSRLAGALASERRRDGARAGELAHTVGAGEEEGVVELARGHGAPEVQDRLVLPFHVGERHEQNLPCHLGGDHGRNPLSALADASQWWRWPS
jgi:hypothetical protein